MSTLQMQERGGCLTIWLLFMVVANTLTALYYIFGLSTMQQFYPNVSSVLFLLLAACCAVNLISVYGLWTWKRWGFYLFIASTLAVLAINLAVGLPVFTALTGLVGLGIVWLLLRSRWTSFA